MRFLVISDIHGDVEVLDKLDNEFSKADIVLFAGDFANEKDTETGLPVLQKLIKKHETIYSVLGNCDDPDFIEHIEENDISVENTIVFHENLAFTGCGGGTIHTGKSPNERTEEDILSDLHIVTDQDTSDWNNLITIMHNPPKNTKTDMIDGGIHVGSEMLYNWIEKIQPLLVVTGHIHESAGIDKINNTVVINPGPLCNGNYGIVEIQKENGIWVVKNSSLEKLS